MVGGRRPSCERPRVGRGPRVEPQLGTGHAKADLEHSRPRHVRVTQNHLDREPVHQRREPKGEVVGIHRLELAGGDTIADDVGDLLARPAPWAQEKPGNTTGMYSMPRRRVSATSGTSRSRAKLSAPWSSLNLPTDHGLITSSERYTTAHCGSVRESV